MATEKDKAERKAVQNMSDIPLKKCANCPNSYPATLKYFYAHNQQKDGLQPRCKNCCGLGRTPRRIVPDGYKYCPGCDELLEATDQNFTPSQIKSNRKSQHCRIHAKELRLNYLPIEQQEWRKKHQKPEKEICRDCGEEFPFTEKYFQENPTATHGLIKRCKPCWVAIGQNKLKEVKENQLAYRNTWQYKIATSVGLENDRARRHNIPGKGLSIEDVQYMYLAQEFRCFYCFAKLGTTFQLDHVQPLSKDGLHEQSNCVLACTRCNKCKGPKELDDWLDYLLYYIFKLKR